LTDIFLEHPSTNPMPVMTELVCNQVAPAYATYINDYGAMSYTLVPSTCGKTQCVPAGNFPAGMYMICFNGTPEEVGSLICAASSVAMGMCCCKPHIGLGCLASDSKVRMGDRSERKVTEVRQGDLLWNPVTRKAVKVAGVFPSTITRDMVTVFTDQGGKIQSTDSHPFRTQRGDVRADRLKRGDVVLTPAGTARVARLEKKVVKDAAVVNFLIAPDSKDPAEHQLEANGLIVGDAWLQRELEKKKFLSKLP